MDGLGLGGRKRGQSGWFWGVCMEGTIWVVLVRAGMAMWHGLWVSSGPSLTTLGDSRGPSGGGSRFARAHSDDAADDHGDNGS